MGMQIKKYRAASLQEAIEKIRHDLGDGAIILQTDPVNGNGMFSKDKIEVTAAIDRKELPRTFEFKVEGDENERDLAADLAPTKKEKSKGLFGMLNRKNKTASSPRKSKAQAKKPNSKEASKKADEVAQFAASAASEGAGTKAHTVSNKESSMGQLYAMKTFIEPLQEEVGALKAQLSKDKDPLKRERTSASLETEVGRLREDLNQYINEKRYEDSSLPIHYRKIMDFWKSKGVSDKQVFKLFKDLEAWEELPSAGMRSAEVTSHLTPALGRRIQQANVLRSEKPRIVVLIGPTGVGKTTTIAKLAAYEKLRLHRNVALVTVDDYKIGGTDQIANYARILKVPFAKPRSDMSLEEQVGLLDADTIFVDTYGISPFDRERIVSLRKALNLTDAELKSRLEVHLTLPVGISAGDVENYLHAFEGFRPKYLIFTKWDETSNWGGMLDAIIASNRPVSFIGHGQSVPDDLSVFSSNQFIKTITTVDG